MKSFLIAILTCLSVRAAVGQTAAEPERASLGLSAVGHVGYHVGFATLEHDARAADIGISVDLGHLPQRKLRIFAEISALRSVSFSEYVVQEDRTYSGPFFDLSGHVGLTWLTRDAQERIVPYLAIGAGVHALSSSFGSIPIDQRYNSNNFGILGAAGVRTRLRANGRHAISLEIRRTQVRDVSRSSIHLGMLRFFGELSRRQRSDRGNA